MKIIRKKETLLFIVIGLASLAILVYGYRSSANLGSITVHVPYAGSTVFMNNVEVRSTTANEQDVEIGRVAPGEQSVLVHKEGYYPWKKTLAITKGERTTVFPFLVKQTPERHDIESSTFIDARPPATEKKRKVSPDGTIVIENINNVLSATRLTKTSSPLFCETASSTESTDTKETCSDTVVISNIQQGIKDIDFLPGRNDIVLFSSDAGIYAIEIDGRGTRNFQPVYEGAVNEFFTNTRTSSVYVATPTSTFQIFP